jgi:hypothetical protein
MEAGLDRAQEREQRRLVVCVYPYEAASLSAGILRRSRARCGVGSRVEAAYERILMG